MKNSGIEWIGEIPDSWDTLPLKRMVEKHFGGCWGEDAKNNKDRFDLIIADKFAAIPGFCPGIGGCGASGGASAAGWNADGGCL